MSDLRDFRPIHRPGYRLATGVL